MFKSARTLIAPIVVGFTLFAASLSHSACYSDTKDFDANTGYSYNIIWSNCLPTLPADCYITSAAIQLRTKVWSWGSYPYQQDVLASDTTVFYNPADRVGILNTATNPSSSNFYTTTFNLKPEQYPAVLNDGCINFDMVTYGGTYYMDWAKLDVCCSDVPACEGNFDGDSDVDALDLEVLAGEFGQSGSPVGYAGDFNLDNDVDGKDLAVLIQDYGRTNCP
jgi:hypothetical protein